MIKSTKNRYGYINEVTHYLDKFLVFSSQQCSNYIYDSPANDRWLIRVPGATRGNILVKDGLIKEITLYEDSFCYRREVLDNINQFIGKKIDLTVETVLNK